ncbi:UDP-N-acetylmuramoyl-tripeptide--D-alanyl-D-alanine ligase [Gleimia coleocanis DSM 15436]|uniref:UDP-N-acetylmuramoyl-tripeptide--D-alanyl-D-alanine ligase n=1 Tax=Gleimia coleocanis DSM 15436 TaxID=525245 RepID=C0VZA8_9ACTO|nr:UDP-N-acetylmuramoyl-tripeptide--D-alanyl-D-alanine ligase [Gleimia coleocanis]EEH64209.1 UDP-N-acetylmuramoyl-tripeptide--D-alanyl-D-alanine ligase [Gleimia coleocanis DSM 15436]
MNYQASWIAQAVNGKLLGADVVVSGSVETDSRECGSGSLYVARVGEATDGHNFIDSAIANGAVCAIVTNPSIGNPEHTRILVEDATYALGLLAKVHIERLRATGDLRIVGITGSVGKTTTKDLTAGILAKFAPTVAPVASFNNEVGMPLTALKADENTRYLVLEMGASGIGHLEYLTGLVSPDLGVELSVGRAHLGGFGSVAGLARAKAELVEGVKENGLVILNLDDPNVAAMETVAHTPVVYFSALGNEKADIYARNVTLDEFSHASFEAVTTGEVIPVHLGLVGAHQVNNALAAISICQGFGLELPEIVAALNGMKAASPHRMSIVESRGATFIDDSYNANPDSMKAGLAVLAKQGEHANQRIAVLGEMMELGETSAQLHQEVGEMVVATQVDLLITLGEGAKEIAVPLTEKTTHFHAGSVAEAVKLLEEKVVAGDVVFLKGSNGSGVWKVADKFVAE